MKINRLVCGIGINDADYVVENRETVEVNGKRKYKRVYEDVSNEVEGYTKVDDLNSFKWVINRADKELYYSLIERDVPVESYHKYKLGDICHNYHGEVVSTNSYGISKIVDECVEKVFFIHGEFYTKNNAIDFNYEEYCEGGYVVKTRGGLDVTQIKKLDVSGVFPVVGVINGQTIQTWTEGGSMSPFNHENEGDLVMYKV